MELYADYDDLEEIEYLAIYRLAMGRRCPMAFQLGSQYFGDCHYVLSPRPCSKRKEWSPFPLSESLAHSALTLVYDVDWLCHRNLPQY